MLQIMYDGALITVNGDTGEVVIDEQPAATAAAVLEPA
jgi:hypothetical protein